MTSVYDDYGFPVLSSNQSDITITQNEIEGQRKRWAKFISDRGGIKPVEEPWLWQVNLLVYFLP